MTLPEFFAEFESRDYYARDGRFAGKLSQADVDDLMEWVGKDAP